ncbi:two-component system regulatory protein YycI [Gudongella sp. SC589]|jgi:regulatory protein YycI of two-component signal transduction system YycFG|uniref:two-component system regulatory protein YycI n=1 Tax=Gudongella sp. SC589 TaxID=3385990 RepID=UPI003904B2A9
MDWSKAKTILIVALLVTNIFLAYFLYGAQDTGNAVLDPEFIQETEDLLGRNGIVLQTEIPTKTQQLYNLTVEYEIMQPGRINESFFGSEGTINRSEGAVVEIDNGKEEVTVINEKLMIYENSGEEAVNSIEDIEQAVDLALGFLQERGYETQDMGLSYWRETETGYYLDFTKTFQDSYIELSYTLFRIENGNIVRMERTWLNTKEIEQTDYKIVPAPKAILELLSMGDASNKTITDITLCYYFDPEKQEYLDDYQQAKEGRAVPAWRVQFKDGYKVILDLE